jgi:hypothetical protein
MPKLNQIVAVVAGKKTRAEKEFGDLNKIVQKKDLFDGLTRNYAPLKEGGENQPSETKLPQKSIADVLTDLRGLLTGIMDAVATQEVGNTFAKADVKVDGQVILSSVPVTVLLYLEKQLNDFGTFVGNFPTLDPSEEWGKNEATGQYQTKPVKSLRTKKEQKPIVMYPATEQHPAQTVMITEDVTVGEWTTVKFSSVMTAMEKKAILGRIVKIQDAVKVAREEANSIEIKDTNIAAPVLKYVFGN